MQANVLKTAQAVGGCVPNTIIDLAKIDPDLFLSAVGKVGNDDNGRFILSTLRKYGIDTSGILTDEHENTSCSYVMSEEKSGERTFFYVKGANRNLAFSDIDIMNLDCEIFHIGYILLLEALDAKDEEYGTRMAHLLHDIQLRGIKTSVDVISTDSGDFSGVIPALRYCDYAILNEIESCGVTGLSPRHADGSLNIKNIRRTMEKFREYGVREKVIVHAAEGGFILDKSGVFTAVPSLVLPDGFSKGSVGAGDAFAAGCLYGLYHGYDDNEILRFASCAAACSLSSSDSISGMKNKKDVEKMEHQYPRGTFQEEISCL